MLSYLSGATFTGPCTNVGTTWSCGITKTGYQGKFVWTTKWLSTDTLSVATPYKQYRDIKGTIHPLNGATKVTITNQPILLE